MGFGQNLYGFKKDFFKTLQFLITFSACTLCHFKLLCVCGFSCSSKMAHFEAMIIDVLVDIRFHKAVHRTYT